MDKRNFTFDPSVKRIGGLRHTEPHPGRHKAGGRVCLASILRRRVLVQQPD